MRKAFVIVSHALFIVFGLQFVFAAVGAFTETGDDNAYVLHSITGMAVLPALTLATTLLAVLSKAPGRLVALTVLPLGLIILQVLLAGLADGFTGVASSVVGGLHAVNGIVAVHVAVAVARGAARLTRPVLEPA
ncbi:DUF6220 domain-containing protein [Actinoplanes solisilvae]|uniref:DUF6220 domain-containing protein n=1 Tax=Actinoplanes solisilvae TaxID=2486853 RepID=UPI000FDB6D96|nr:DUF6220 domain-containing protein [Actinoplanes solisilvae]